METRFILNFIVILDKLCVFTTFLSNKKKERESHILISLKLIFVK